MTPRQSFALFTLTGVDVRLVSSTISLDTASGFITLAKSGHAADIRDRLVQLGGVLKQPLPKPKQDWQFIWNQAYATGAAAAIACKPTPMVVEGHANPLDDNSAVTQRWVVPQGVCGFAWVEFPGNTSFGRWAVKEGYAKPKYGGGVSYWISAYGQSMEMKYAHASAMAKKLRELGVERVYAGSRED